MNQNDGIVAYTTHANHPAARTISMRRFYNPVLVRADAFVRPDVAKEPVCGSGKERSIA